MQEEIERLLMEIQRSRMSDRRTEARQPFVRPIEVHRANAESVAGFSKDLSNQGIGVVLPVEFKTGTLAVLEIHCTTSDPVFLRCEVRWCDSFGRGWFLTGWKFIALSGPVR